MNRRLYEIAVRLVGADGWSALNLDRIAAEAGVSRATVWRHGVTRASVEQEMRRQLAADYRALLWPILTRPGTGAERLEAGLAAVCELADRHLSFLAHSELYLHEAEIVDDGVEVNMLEPFVRWLEDGRADGSVSIVEDSWPYAAMLLNAVTLTYVHLRARHAEFGWTSARTREYVLRLVASGYRPRVNTGSPARKARGRPAAE